MQVLLALVGPMDRLHDGVVGSAGVFFFIYYTKNTSALFCGMEGGLEPDDEKWKWKWKWRGNMSLISLEWDAAKLLLREVECPITVRLPPIIDNRPWRKADGGWRRLGNLGCGCAANAEGLAC